MNRTKKATMVVGLGLTAILLMVQHVWAQPAPCYTVPGGVQTLNGTNNYSTIAYTSSMAQPSLTGKISISAWVCPNQTDTPQMVFKREGAYQLQVNAWDDPRFYFAVWTSTGIHGLVSDICLDTLRWQHIAGTYDGTNWRVYHNGRLVGSLVASYGSPVSGGTASMWVGANIVSGIPQMFFGGNLSGMSVYDVALTPDQVAALATNPPVTLPPPVGSSTRTQTVNGTAITLEVGNGLRLNQMGGGISSAGGRLFVVNVNGSPISSDRVTVRQGEITTLNGGWQIPFNLPSGQGAGVLEFLPGGAPGLVQAKLSLTNSGASGEWQVAFPHLEGMSLNGLAPPNAEFFFPFKEGWVGRGEYDLSVGYGYVGWLPIVAAWNTNGPGIAIQGRDTNFTYCSLRYKNASTDISPTAYNGSVDNFAGKFSITKPGASLARYSLPFTLGTGATWNMSGAVIQVFPGTNKFKDVLSGYGQWARANWWMHDPVPATLRDRFISEPHHENNNGNWWGGEAESIRDTYHAHPTFEWAYWWDHEESISCGSGPYMLTQGNYGFESNWGGAPAYAADVGRCRSAGVSTLLYLQARIVWKQSQVGLAHKTDWGWMHAPGVYNEDWTGEDVYGCTGNYWSMCPQAVGWHQYLSNACLTALQGSGADGVRLDTASEYLVCYNTNHPHTDTLNGIRAFLQTVRGGVKALGADKFMMSEFCGSDAAAQYLDGSLAQGHDAGFSLADQMFGYGVLPFRFVYPEVKLFEWGYMDLDSRYHRASRRMLFNGVGTTLGTAVPSYVAELYHFSEVMRGVGDVLASTDCEPLYPTMVSGVVANRFSLNGREVYTLWNQSGATVSGQTLRVPGGSGRRFVNMVTGRAVTTAYDGSGDIVSLTISNDEVVMLGVFPEKVIQSTRASLSQTFYIQSTQPLSLQVVDAATDEILASGGSAITVDDAVVSGRPVVVRAVQNGYLVHDILEVAPGNTVLLYDLNEGAGTTATNAVPGGPNATLSSGATVWTTSGRFGNGLISTANNTNGYLGASLGLNLFTNQQFTLSAWIKPTTIDPNGGSYIMGLDDNAGGNAGAFLRLEPGANNIRFAVYNVLPPYTQKDLLLTLGAGVNVLDGAWRHVAAIYSNRTMRIFLNGKELGSTATPANFTLAQPARFIAAGNRPWNPNAADGYRYMGYIDEIRVSKVAITDFSEIWKDPYITWTNYYGLGGTNAAGTADPDADGLSNINEFLAGFNPTNNSAVLRILGLAVTNGSDLVITYRGANGDVTYPGGPVSRTNVLEYNANLLAGFSSTGLTNVLSGGNGLGTNISVTVPGAATNDARFFRVRVLTP